MEIFQNSNFVVGVGFVLFLAILAYYRVPEKLSGLLDKRSQRIRSELDEARRLREEAQSMLASYERKQKEVESQAESIVANARRDAEQAAEQAKADLERSIERRIQAARDQIASAEASAVKEVKDRAVAVAVAAAARVIRERMDESTANAMLDRSIEEVGGKLH